VFDASGSPSCNWYFEVTQGNWESYFELSNIIEEAYKRDRQGRFQLSYAEIDFRIMKEINQEVKGARRILRSIWFWQDDNLFWCPYSAEINQKLESIWKSMKPGDKEAIITSPRRDIFYGGGTKFKQIRCTSHGNPDGRDVTRGFPGEGQTYSSNYKPPAEQSIQESTYIRKTWLVWKIKISKNDY